MHQHAEGQGDAELRLSGAARSVRRCHGLGDMGGSCGVRPGVPTPWLGAAGPPARGCLGEGGGRHPAAPHARRRPGRGRQGTIAACPGAGGRDAGGDAKRLWNKAPAVGLGPDLRALSGGGGHGYSGCWQGSPPRWPSGARGGAAAAPAAPEPLRVTQRGQKRGHESRWRGRGDGVGGGGGKAPCSLPPGGRGDEGRVAAGGGEGTARPPPIAQKESFSAPPAPLAARYLSAPPPLSAACRRGRPVPPGPRTMSRLTGAGQAGSPGPHPGPLGPPSLFPSPTALPPGSYYSG